MERVQDGGGVPQSHFTNFEFVRLAPPREAAEGGMEEHLTPPVALVGGGRNLKLGYPTVMSRDAGDLEEPVQNKTLVMIPLVPSAMRTLSEGLSTFVMMMIFLGVLTDMTRGTHAPSALIGLVGSAFLALVGFQGLRQSNAALTALYILGTIVLLTAAFCGYVQGVLAHGFLHVMGACLGMYNLQMMKPRKFFV